MAVTQLGLPGMGGGGPQGGGAARTLAVVATYRDAGLLKGVQQANAELEKLKKNQSGTGAGGQGGIAAGAKQWQGLTASIHQARAAVGQFAKAQHEAQAGFNQIGKGITGLAAPISGLKTGIYGLVGGFAALASEAKVAESKEKSFMQAVSQLGVDGKRMIQTMREQSKGMVSEITLYERANTGMMLIQKEAFKQAGGQVKVMSELLQVAMASARATGRTVEYSFESAINGIARMSPLWLDNLGIGLRLGTVYEDAAKKLGKSADAMSMAEKQTALLNKVLEQGMENVRKFGISSGGIKTQFEILSARSKDFAYHLGKTFIPVLTGVVKELQGLVKVADDKMVPAFEALWKTFNKLSQPIKNFVVGLSAMKMVGTALTPVLAALGHGDGSVLGGLLRKLPLLGGALMAVSAAARESGLIGKWTGELQRLDRVAATIKVDRVQAAIDTISKKPADKQTEAEVKQLEALRRVQAAKKALDAEEEKAAQERAKRIASAPVTVGYADAGSQASLVGAKRDAKARAEAIVDEETEALKKARAEFEQSQKDAGVVWEIIDTQGTKSYLAGVWKEIQESAGGILMGLGEILADDFLSSFFGKMDGAFNSEDVYAGIKTFADRTKEYLGMLREFIEGFNIAGDVGATGVERLGLAAEFAAEKYPGLKDAIAQVVEVFITLQGWVADAKAFWAEHGDEIKLLAEYYLKWKVASALVVEPLLNIAAGVIKVAASVGMAKEGLLMFGKLLGMGGGGAAAGAGAGGIAGGAAAGTGALAALKAGILGLSASTVVGGAAVAAMAVAWAKDMGGIRTESKGMVEDIRKSFKQTEGLMGSLLGGQKAAEDVAQRFSRMLVGLSRAYFDWADRLTESQQGSLFGHMLKKWEPDRLKLKAMLQKFAAEMRTWWTAFTNNTRNARSSLYNAWTEALGGIGAAIDRAAPGLLDKARNLGNDIMALLGTSVFNLPGGGKGPSVGKVATYGLAMGAGFAIAGPPGAAAAGLAVAVGDMAVNGGGGKSSKPVVSYDAEGRLLWNGKPMAGARSDAEAQAAYRRPFDHAQALRERARAEAAARAANKDQGGGAIPPESPADMPGGEGGGGGGGGGDGGGGGGGEGKDPVAEAYQTISGISGAIKSAIDAMKSAWSEWRGAAPDQILTEIFKSMEDMADRMIEVAAKFSPEKMANAGAAAQSISTIASTMGSVVDAFDKLARVRFPSQGRLEAVFGQMKLLAQFALKLTDDSLETGLSGAMKGGGKGSKLETSIQRTELAKGLAEVITGWAGAMASTAEGLDKLSRARMGGLARLPMLRGIWEQVMELGRSLTADATAQAGGTLTPRTFLEQKDVADALGVWLKTVSDTIDIAGKLFATRQSRVDLTGPQRILRQVVDLAMAITRDMGAAYGEDLLIRLEDLKLVSEALAPWAGLMASVTDLAAKLGDARVQGVDLGLLTDKVFGLGHIARTMTEAFQRAFGSEDFLSQMEDLRVTAESLTPWTQLLGGMVAPLEAIVRIGAQVERGVSMATGPLEALLSAVGQMALRLLAASQKGMDPADWVHLQADLKVWADSMGAVLAPIASIGGTLDTLERLSARMQGQGGGIGQQHFDKLADLLAGLAASAGQLYARAMAGLGDDWKKKLEQSMAIASSFSAWLAPVTALAAAVESLRMVGVRGDVGQTIDNIFGEKGLLQRIAVGAWGFVKNVWGRSNPAGEADISKAVAANFEGWVGMLSKLGDMVKSLRRLHGGIDRKILAEIFGTGKVDVNTGKPDGLLADIAWAAWPLLKAVLRTPMAKEAQELSQVVANTFATWIGLINGVVGLSRSMRLMRDIDTKQITDLQPLLESLRIMGLQLTNFFRNRPDGKDQADGMKAGLEALSAMVNVIGQAAGLGRVLRQQIEPTVSEWQVALRTVRAAWGYAWELTREMVPSGPALDDWKEDELPRLTAWADAMRTALGVWDGVGKLASGLVRVVEPMANEWTAAKRMLQEAWKQAQELFSDSGLPEMHPDDVTTFQARWKGFWEALGGAIGGFGQIAELADRLSGSRMVDVRGGQMAKLAAQIRSIWGLAQELFAALVPDLAGTGAGEQLPGGPVQLPGGGDPERVKAAALERLGFLRAFTDAVGPMVAAFGAVADLLAKLDAGRELRGMSGGAREAIGRAMREVFFDLEGLFDEWMGSAPGGSDPERWKQELRQRLADQQAFLGVLASSIGATGGLADLMTKIHDAAGRLTDIGPSTRALLGATARTVVELMQELSESFKYGTWAGKRAVDHAAEFAGQLSQVVGAVGGVADMLLKIDSVLWETIDPGTGDPRHTEPGPRGQRARVGSTTREQLPTRRRRMLEVTREHVRGLIDTARMVFEEMQRGWEEFKACIVTANGELPDYAEIVQEVNVFAQALANVTGAASSVLQMMQLAIENPLAVLPYHTSMGGKNRDRAITRYYSDSAMSGRTARAEHLATQLKEGLKRAIRMMVEAVNEAAKEQTARVDPEAAKAIALLGDTVRSVIRMVTEIQQMPDFDLKRIEKLVEAAKLLSGAPWGAIKQAMGSGGLQVGKGGAGIDLGMTASDTYGAQAVGLGIGLPGWRAVRPHGEGSPDVFVEVIYKAVAEALGGGKPDVFVEVIYKAVKEAFGGDRPDVFVEVIYKAALEAFGGGRGAPPWGKLQAPAGGPEQSMVQFGRELGKSVTIEPPQVDVTVEPAEVQVVVYVDGSQQAPEQGYQTSVRGPKRTVTNRNKRADAWTASGGRYKDYINRTWD